MAGNRCCDFHINHLPKVMYDELRRSNPRGEERYQREPAHDETPERIFERRWALSLLDRVVERLRDEFVQHGRPEHFERLKVFRLGQSEAPMLRWLAK